MSTVVRVGDDVVVNVGDDKNVEKSVRRDKETFVVEEAIVAEVPHPDELAIAALSEEFGIYKFVDFETGKEGSEGRREKRNSSTSVKISTLLFSTAFLIRTIFG